MLRKLHLFVVLFAMALFALTGCSDSDDDNPVVPPVSGGDTPGGGDTPVIPPVTASFTATFEGPGGHSNGAYGAVNAVHAASRALMALDKTVIAKTTTYKVTNFKGGNSVNSIAFDGAFTVEVTAANDKDLADFKTALETAVAKGVSDENTFRGRKVGDTNSSGGRIDVRGSVAQN